MPKEKACKAGEAKGDKAGAQGGGKGGYAAGKVFRLSSGHWNAINKKVEEARAKEGKVPQEESVWVNKTVRVCDEKHSLYFLIMEQSCRSVEMEGCR